MRLPVEDYGEVALSRRQDHGRKDGNANDKTVLIVVAVTAIVLFAITAAGYIVLRTLRAKNASPKYVPGAWLQEKWRRWTPTAGKGRYSARLQRSLPTVVRRHGRERIEDEQEMMTGPSEEAPTDTTTTAPTATAAPTTTDAGAAGVDRNTSVRSIMTLPAYSPAARENERILAREGERGGIDTVLEFPETADEEEARREEEMASLYQIRVARRQENAEREERRRQRREARARGDWETLENLRRESRQRAESAASGATPSNAQALVAEHQAQNRDRRVSSVQYADLGVARHDGTRLRANSNDSDSRPLLDSAASIAGTSSRPVSSRTLTTHHRGRSTSSVLTLSSMASEERPQGLRSASRGSGTTDFEVVGLSHSRSPSASRSVMATSDVGDMPIPPLDPPQYDNLGWEDAPPYESPVQSRAPQLPALEHLPAIEVTTSLSPVEESPAVVSGGGLGRDSVRS